MTDPKQSIFDRYYDRLARRMLARDDFGDETDYGARLNRRGAELILANRLWWNDAKIESVVIRKLYALEEEGREVPDAELDEMVAVDARVTPIKPGSQFVVQPAPGAIAPSTIPIADVIGNLWVDPEHMKCLKFELNGHWEKVQPHDSPAASPASGAAKEDALRLGMNRYHEHVERKCADAWAKADAENARLEAEAYERAMRDALVHGAGVYASGAAERDADALRAADSESVIDKIVAAGLECERIQNEMMEKNGGKLVVYIPLSKENADMFRAIGEIVEAAEADGKDAGIKETLEKVAYQMGKIGVYADPQDPVAGIVSAVRSMQRKLQRAKARASDKVAQEVARQIVEQVGRHPWMAPGAPNASTCSKKGCSCFGKKED